MRNAPDVVATLHTVPWAYRSEVDMSNKWTASAEGYRNLDVTTQHAEDLEGPVGGLINRLHQIKNRLGETDDAGAVFAEWYE